jgi:hypothetical protein
MGVVECGCSILVWVFGIAKEGTKLGFSGRGEGQDNGYD